MSEDRHYHGQWGCDRALVEILQKDKVKGGFFLEVGGWDGVQWSNCFYLEKVCGWDGIILEPIPQLAGLCRMHRWCDVKEQALWKQDELVNFILVKGYASALSGIEQLIPSFVKNRTLEEVKIHGGEISSIKVQGVSLATLLTKPIDYLSLDVQGGELEILQGMPSDAKIKAISLDTNGYQTDSILELLTGRGYRKVWKSSSSDEMLLINDSIPWTLV